jgi:hypothetical protein
MLDNLMASREISAAPAEKHNERMIIRSGPEGAFFLWLAVFPAWGNIYQSFLSDIEESFSPFSILRVLDAINANLEM